MQEDGEPKATGARRLVDLAAETLSLNLLCGSYIEYLEIPVTLRQKLRGIIKGLWAKQPPVRDATNYDYSSIDLSRGLDRLQFNMMMNIPPVFRNPWNEFDLYSVRFEYYELRVHAPDSQRMNKFHYSKIGRVVYHIQMLLCTSCFETFQELSYDDARRFWSQDKSRWEFFKYRWEMLTHRDDIRVYLGDVSNYCDCCVKTPLYNIVGALTYEDLYDHYHRGLEIPFDCREVYQRMPSYRQ